MELEAAGSDTASPPVDDLVAQYANEEVQKMNIRSIAVATLAIPVVSIIGHAVLKRDVAPMLANATVTITTGNAVPAGGASQDPRPDRAAVVQRSGRDAVTRTVARRPVPTVGRLVPIAQADDARWR
jgi:hypothetical protein